MIKNLLNPAASAALTLTALAVITTNAPAQAIIDDTADAQNNNVAVWAPGYVQQNFVAQSFNTGPDASLLTSISPYFAFGIGSSFQLALYSDASGTVGTEIGLLSGSTSPSGNSYTYTAAGSGISLAPSTTYWFVASASGSDHYTLETTFSSSSTTTDGWSINNSLDVNSGSGWSAGSGQQVLFSADATFTPTPEPGSLALIALGAGTGAVFFRRRQKN